MGTGWFSCDQDSGKVVAKTEIHDDGTVHRYSYTSADDISAGHGHDRYDSYDKFAIENNKEIANPDWSRNKYDRKSINKRWRGNGYDLGINDLEKLSFDELHTLSELAKTKFIHTPLELMAKYFEDVDKTTEKQLVLKR